jgi:hypothetical protein
VVVDDYTELRTRISEHKNELKGKESTTSEFLEKKMKNDLKGEKSRKSASELDQWVFCSV